MSDGSDSVGAGWPASNASTTTITLGGSYTAFNNVRVVAATTGTADNVVFDNARTGSIAIVPEAGTLALLLPTLGVLGAVVVRRKRIAG